MQRCDLNCAMCQDLKRELCLEEIEAIETKGLEDREAY